MNQPHFTIADANDNILSYVLSGVGLAITSAALVMWKALQNKDRAAIKYLQEQVLDLQSAQEKMDKKYDDAMSKRNIAREFTKQVRTTVGNIKLLPNKDGMVAHETVNLMLAQLIRDGYESGVYSTLQIKE